MKFHLVERRAVIFGLGAPEKTQYPFKKATVRHSNILVCTESIGNSKVRNYLLKKFHEFKDSKACLEEDSFWELDVAVGISEKVSTSSAEPSSNRLGCLHVTEKCGGGVLEALSNLSDHEVAIRLLLTVNNFTVKLFPATIKTEEMIISRGKKLLCSDGNLEFPLTHFGQWPKPYKFWTTVSIVVTAQDENLSADYHSCSQPFPVTSSYCLKMFKELHSDVKIVTCNGVRFKAEKYYLAEQSPVLLAMFQNDINESRVSVLYFQNMREESVHIFFKYLFQKDTTFENCGCHVVFELLVTANKYQISPMQNKLKLFILAKPDTWLEEDVARKYAQVDICTADEEIKTKIAKAIKQYDDMHLQQKE